MKPPRKKISPKLAAILTSFLLPVMIPLGGCKSSPKASSPEAVRELNKIKTSDYFLMPGFQQVTFQGDNELPSFSPGGGKLLFISRGRPAHATAQVYETDLIGNRERRITFNDGTDSWPRYVNDQEIVYSSTTDEIKESVYLNKGGDKDFPSYEIYRSDVFGNDIQRLTHYPGYDGESVISPLRIPTLYFTSRRGGIVGIFKWQLIKDHGTVSFISADKTKEKRFPALAPDGERLAWIEKDLKSGQTSLQLMNLRDKKAGSVTLKSEEGATYQDLFWQPASEKLFYSVIRKGEKSFHLEAYDIAKKCTQALFKGKESLTQPVVSAARKPQIAFVRLIPDQKQSRRQIYIVDLPPDLGPCFEETSAAKIDK